MRMTAIRLGLAAVLAMPAAAHAQLVLKASHQFPGGKGDVRDDMLQLIAKEAQAANVGLTVQVYPGASLFKPNQQWDAMINGQLDMSLFPLDYASGKVPAFSATLMPGLIRSQDRAKRIDASPFMTDVRAEIEKNGVMVLSDAWFAGGMAAKGKCILLPDDLKGMKFRAAGPTFAAMWEAAGASIVSPPSNEIYNAFQTGVVTGTDTSLGTFDSMRLYEVTSCLTAAGDNALWFMYEPVLMSKMRFREAQQGPASRHRQGRQGRPNLFRGQGRCGEQRGDQGLQGPQREGGDARRRAVQRLARPRQEEFIQEIRSGRAQRPEADRRGAGGQIGSSPRIDGRRARPPSAVCFRTRCKPQRLPKPQQPKNLHGRLHWGRRVAVARYRRHRRFPHRRRRARHL